MVKVGRREMDTTINNLKKTFMLKRFVCVSIVQLVIQVYACNKMA